MHMSQIWASGQDTSRMSSWGGVSGIPSQEQVLGHSGKNTSPVWLGIHPEELVEGEDGLGFSAETVALPDKPNQDAKCSFGSLRRKTLGQIMDILCWFTLKRQQKVKVRTQDTNEFDELSICSCRHAYVIYRNPTPALLPISVNK